MKFYTAKGIIRYNNDWVIVECPDDIINYYRYWVERFIGKKVSTPFYGAHITVLAGKYEKGLNKHPNWGKHDGETIEFLYESHIYTDSEWFTQGAYFWLRVDHPLLRQIRQELGLKPYPFHPFHMTVCYCGY